MLYFITGNQHKIEIARHELEKFAVDFQTQTLDLTEIQSESIEEIAQHKAKEAFQQLQKPLIVKDDGWFITSLNGFPGPYMHYVNKWFTTNDFLQLLKNKENRENILHEVICYIDNNNLKTFSGEIKGHILAESRGNDLPNNNITSMRHDGKTIAECRAMGEPFYNESPVWGEFATWYKSMYE